METETQATETKEQFVIETREHAEWYLRNLANLDREEASIKAQAEAMLRRVASEREKHTGRYQSQLESFVRGELERTKSKRRSVLFFNGTAQFTTTPARLVVESEADALQTARMVCPEALVEIPATEKLDKKVLGEYAKRQLAECGEIIPGYALTEGGERFAVKFAAEKAGETEEGGIEP